MIKIWVTGSIVLLMFLYSCNTFKGKSEARVCSREAFYNNEKITKLVNDYRRKNSQEKLFLDSELIALAGKRAWSISKSKNFSHYDSSGKSPMLNLKQAGIVRNFIGENLGYVNSENDFLASVLQNWKNGEKENTILLSGKYIRIGSGFGMIGRKCVVVSIFTD